MSHKIARAIVLKFGGNAMDGAAEAAVAAGIAALQAQGRPVAVVHGGGPEIDRALTAAGIVSERIGGLRVTSAEALAVTESVLCGTINKRLVRALSAAGVRAAGMSGMDGMLLQARHLPELGFVGEIARVETGILQALFNGGYVPVIAPLGIVAETLQPLNVNADTAASAIAGALRAESFVLMTNVNRVRANAADPASGIDCLSLPEARRFADSSACEGSMRPKMLAAVAAVAAGVSRAIIGSSGIRELLSGDGTVVTSSP